jgi:hypothetical protein
MGLMLVAVLIGLVLEAKPGIGGRLPITLPSSALSRLTRC